MKPIEPAEVAAEGDPGSAPPVARARAQQVLNQFLANPDGEARQTLERCLVAQLAAKQARRESAASAANYDFQQQYARLRRHAERLFADNLNAGEENQRLARQAADAEAIRQSVEREVALLERGAQAREVTHEEIFRRISAVIGMGGGLVERVEKTVPEDSRTN